MPDTRPLPTVIGPTENALRALLVGVLVPTRITGYAEWVAINAAAAHAATPGAPWKESLGESLGIAPDAVDAVLDRLAAAGLLGRDSALTPLGTAELTHARAAVSAATALVMEGIGDDELQAARRVLDLVRARAQELVAARAG